MRCTEDRHGKRMAVPLHSHEFHEIVVVTGGEGRHVMTDDEYPLAEGDVFLIRGRAVHGYAEPEALSYVNVLFDPKTLRLPMDDLKRVPGYHVLFRVEPKLRGVHRLRGCLKLSPEQLAETSRLVALTEAELSERGPGYRYMAVAHLMQMIGFLSRAHSSGEEPERRPLLRMGEVLSHIDRHFDEPITVDALCEIADMSESSLARTFHEVVGRPPMDYVIRVRVGKAADLLARSRLRVTEIALRSGFTDSNYFSRRFRSVTGQSPREYRRSRAGR
jgi:AraC-like DNA-binding protein